MSVEFRCGDPAALASYLYGECEAAERQAIEAHLSACADCGAELRALGATRVALASWTPPDARLGFRIAADEGPAVVLRPAQWWRRPLPAWAQAAAAAVIFAAGMGLGLRSAERAPAPAEARAAVAPASTVSADDLAALERRLRSEMQGLRATATAAAAPAERAGGAEADVLQRVRALIADSEQRQDRELALRVAQMMRDVDAQRRLDLIRIERTFGQMEGFTRPELADQRQMLNYLIQRTGAQRPPRE